MALPKFYVGQRVVAVRDHSAGWFKKGQEFTVHGVEKGCCYEWGIYIGRIGKYDNGHCMFCDAVYKSHRKQYRFSQECFAPIHENFERISFTKAIEEVAVSVN